MIVNRVPGPIACAALAALALAACGGDDSSAPCPTCFLHGHWAVDNLSPCFVVDGAGHVTAASSTVIVAGRAACPADPTMVPSEPWSHDSLTIDCPGRYRLCITLKAGDYHAPQDADCAVATVCVADDAATAGVAWTWAPVGGWAATGAGLTCAQSFVDNGGYAEMSVTGTASACGAVERVFNRVNYCPFRCNADPGGPGCTDCGAGSTGTF